MSTHRNKHVCWCVEHVQTGYRKYFTDYREAADYCAGWEFNGENMRMFKMVEVLPQ